jgi:hypothetical protein
MTVELSRHSSLVLDCRNDSTNCSIIFHALVDGLSQDGHVSDLERGRGSLRPRLVVVADQDLVALSVPEDPVASPPRVQTDVFAEADFLWVRLVPVPTRLWCIFVSFGRFNKLSESCSSITFAPGLSTSVGTGAAAQTLKSTGWLALAFRRPASSFDWVSWCCLGIFSPCGDKAEGYSAIFK